jgi:hypothetical protein
MDKHYSLLQKSVNYGCKKFYSIARCFFLNKLRVKGINATRSKVSSPFISTYESAKIFDFKRQMWME